MTGNRVNPANSEGPGAPRQPTRDAAPTVAIRAFFPVGGVLHYVSDSREDGPGGEGPPDGADDGAWSEADEPAVVPVDPGSPSAENAAFVLLGALLTVFVLARVAGLV